MRIFKKYSFLLFVIFTALIISCDKQVVFEKNKRIPGAIWNKNHILEFPVEITDTITPKNILINLRNLNTYPLTNLFLFITVTSPDGLYNRDTIQYFLAEPSGKWVGKGFGNLWSNRFRYKTNVRFPVTGIYQFKIEQAMRFDDLEGISDVGIRIENVEK